MNDKIKLALQWLKENDVPAYEDDGSIYVSAGRDADVQISTAEIDYRAELQLGDPWQDGIANNRTSFNAPSA
tara:strand:- start:705 stop:920 length:216 start_codon:yes stop_codon:yes gene_type:complete